LSEHEPDFGQVLKVLRREPTDRPVLFEIILNELLYGEYGGPWVDPGKDRAAHAERTARAFAALGYDFCVVTGSGFGFPQGERHREKSVSMNEGALITGRASFEAYDWPDPDAFDYSWLGRVRLPGGMKMIVWGPGGVLENVVGLVGYERLCYMVVDDPELAGDVFDAVGSRLARYYELAAPYETVGALMCNDDWGFKTQTMLPPEMMRRYVIPWHAEAVRIIHDAGKPALLHSCGNLEHVMDDVIDTIGYDGKHSYEDSILPVEDAYERWHERIAILGGIDVDFLCRSAPEEIVARCRAMLERTAERGGYGLGSGNSIPDYVPLENYFAMTSVARG